MARIKWKEVIALTVPVFKDFLGRGIIPTLRTIFYNLVAKQIIPNTKSAYKGLGSQLVKARKEGIVKWEWMADDTRTIFGGDWNEKEPESYTMSIVDKVIDGADNYNLPIWSNQKYYVEIWIEKKAMRRTFSKWTEEYNVTIVPSSGYCGWTFLKEGAERIARELYDDTDNPAIAEYQKRDVGLIRNDKQPIILYFGDFDPSGKDIERHLKESLEWFGLDIVVKRIGVTKEQIERYELPHKPEDADDISRLQKDSRYANWEHGLYAVELDALMGFVPDEFERMVRESVEEYLDFDILEETEEQQERERKEVKEKIRSKIEGWLEEGEEEE